MRLSKFINDFNPLFCWSAGFPIGTLSNIPSEFHFGKNSVVSCLLTKNNTKLFRDSQGIRITIQIEKAADFVYLRVLILFLK